MLYVHVIILRLKPGSIYKIDIFFFTIQRRKVGSFRGDLDVEDFWLSLTNITAILRQMSLNVTDQLL